jgi:hypothetical protein
MISSRPRWMSRAGTVRRSRGRRRSWQPGRARPLPWSSPASSCSDCHGPVRGVDREVGGDEGVGVDLVEFAVEGESELVGVDGAASPGPGVGRDRGGPGGPQRRCHRATRRGCSGRRRPGPRASRSQAAARRTGPRARPARPSGRGGPRTRTPPRPRPRRRGGPGGRPCSQSRRETSLSSCSPSPDRTHTTLWTSFGRRRPPVRDRVGAPHRSPLTAGTRTFAAIDARNPFIERMIEA